jgi:pimeloyl-ACP methyl ester carboxylesterase
MEGFDCPIDVRTVTARDGTIVTYYLAGRGREPWVLAPGLGTNIHCWKHLFEHFQDRFTMLTWDPRGTYRSSVPADLSRLRVEDHTDDMEAIVADLGWSSFVAGGWSMGVEIALEYAHLRPGGVKALTLINGPYEHVLKTALGVRGADRVFDALLRAGQKAAPWIGPLARAFFQWDGAAALLVRLGLAADGTRGHEQFRRVMGEFSGMDWETYLGMIRLLNEHSAASYLPDIRVPTIITAGTNDAMTPIFTAGELNRAIAGSELYVIPAGTHYTMMEFPDDLHRGLEGFLRRTVPAAFAPPPRARRKRG